MDWRLQGQHNYLRNAELISSKYSPLRPEWDHDHCEFCHGKFAISGGNFAEGYSTSDRYHWICQTCFNDFRDELAFKVIATTR